MINVQRGTAPTASTSDFGIVKIDGKTIVVSDGIISTIGQTSGSSTVGYLTYNGSIQGATGTFDSSSTAPTGIQRLNYNGYLYATALYSNLIQPSGTVLTIGSTGANTTISTTTSGTLALTSAGALNHTSAAASTWTHSGGAWLLQSTSQNVTIQTVTSGAINLMAASGNNIALTTAGAGKTLISGNFGFVASTGTANTAGTFDTQATSPTNTTRLNYSGNLYATNFYGNLMGTFVGNAASATVISSYITNGLFESGATTGWSLYNSGASTPTNGGTGGTPTTGTTFAINSSSPLFGSYDAILNIPNSAPAGNGVSTPFTIDSGATGQLIQFSFYYKTSAAYLNGIMGVYLYDVTNSVIIYPSVVNITASTGPALFSAVFAPTSSTSYRFILHQQFSTGSSGTFTMEVDQFYVGLINKPVTPIIGTWTAYPTAPTLSGTASPATTYARWRREGDSLHFKLIYTLTAVVTAQLTVSNVVPNNLTFDAAQLPAILRATAMATSSTTDYVGEADITTSSGAITSMCACGATNWAAAVPFTWASGNVLTIEGCFPISAWTTNVNLATDFTEYASNNGSGGTTAGSTYTTGSVLSNAGSAFVAVNSTTANSNTSYIVTFTRPVQSTDKIFLEATSTSSPVWRDTEASWGWQIQSTSSYGMWWDYYPTDTTGCSILVHFGNMGVQASGATYAAASATAWSGQSSYKWRARKVSNGNMAEVSPNTFYLQTAGSSVAGSLQYNGTTVAAGMMDGSSTNPTGTTRLNYGGNLYATNFYSTNYKSWGTLAIAPASSSALTIGSTSANTTISTTTSGTLALTSAGALNHTSVAASTWTHSGGAWALNSTNQNVTISTVTSGTIALTSAGAINHTSAGASTWTQSAGAWTLNSAGANIVLAQTTATTALTLSDTFATTGTGQGIKLTTINSSTGTGGNLVINTNATAGIGGAIQINTTQTGATAGAISINSAATGSFVTTGSLTLTAGAPSTWSATGNLSISATSGAVALSTTTSGNITVTPASGSNFTLITGGTGTIGLTSNNAINHTSAAASTWTHSGGAWSLQSTSQNVTIQTLTSGSINLNSAAGSNIILTTSYPGLTQIYGNLGFMSGTAGVTGTLNGTTSAPLATNTTQLNYEGVLMASQLAVSTSSPTTPVAGAIYGGTTAPTGTQQVNVNGYVYATKVYNAVWNDLAEFMLRDSNDDAQPGDVLVQTDSGLKKSDSYADVRVVGVYSDTFGYALGSEDQDSKYPVGLAGVVNVKVREPLKIGDFLVSAENGFAAKLIGSNQLGTVLGKVLQTKTDDEISRIKMLIIHI
jgi:hypothetical protein